MTISLADFKIIRLFAGLSETDLSRIASRLEKCVFLSGTVILSKEEPAAALYFIIEGSARVELRDGSGQIFNIAEIGPGEFFGERSILTDEPRTADVRAISAVKAARLSRADFEGLLPETPGLYANLCRALALQLGSWAQRHQREENEHRETMAHVIGWQLLPEFGAFPGNSPWVVKLNRQLGQLGASSRHVLILGEPGTWKDLAARLIHFNGDVSRPVLFLDCAAPPAMNGHLDAPAETNRESLLLQSGQEAALFGIAADAVTYGRRLRRGMVELAAGGDLILRNVDRLTPAVQESLLAFIESGRFKRCGESEYRSSRVRIIATSGEQLDQSAAAGGFNGLLFARLSAETLLMTPLRERKRDIPVIARTLLRTLNAKHHKSVRRFSQDALNRLVDHDWPLNGTELYQVLSRAVIVCEGEEILPEQIFLQKEPFVGGRFNLLTLPLVEELARRPDFPRFFRWTTVPLLLSVLLFTLFGPATANAANLAVWTLWWPALLMTGLLFARGWCSYCPLEAIGEFIGAAERVIREPSPWLGRWGPSISLALFMLIFLLEQATGMFSWAYATGLLLLALLVGTVGGDLYLGRRGWCKYLCPLGRLVSLVSRISVLELHSNHNVCVSRCKVDTCVKEKGCPMGLHPTGMDNADHCVLCLNCVRNCPHNSMQLDLRNPGSGLFQQSQRDFPEALFIILLIGVLIAARAVPYAFGRQPELLPSAVWSGGEFLTALLIALAYTALTLLGSIVRSRGQWKATFTYSGLACLPTAFAALFALYLRAFVESGAELVPLTLAAFRLDSWLDAEKLTPELGTLRLLIYPIIIAGGTYSWILLGQLKNRFKLHPYRCFAQRLLVLLATIAFLYL